ESRFLFTPDSTRRLGAEATRPGPAYLEMWQTVLNSFTFGHNIAIALAGRGPATPARAVWQRAIDWVIVVATLIPLAVVALVVETIAWASGGGGRMNLH